ncbi:MAG TPA: DUF2231 domain-containing protein [Nitrospiria bacterium]|nr:DUF2231 domain-containing protein [Nitrospiria bacterium]
MTHPLHPLTVHFPIALLFTSVFFDLLGMLTDNNNFRQTGWWLLILGLIGGTVAAGIGMWTEEQIEAMGVPEAAVDRHEAFAVTTMIVFAVLAVIRWWRRGRWSARDRVVYLSVAMAGLLLLGITGFYGGELVYRYGAGVQSSGAPRPANPD